jgi:hypothetical protein
MPTFYNDVDGKLEQVLNNLLIAQAATTGSNIASVDIHTGLSVADVTEDLIYGHVESAEESPAGTGNWSCSTTVAIYTSAHGSGLPTHRARVAEVRDVFMSDCIATSITDDSTETLTCVAVQNYSIAQRVEDNYFIGEISFDAICYGSD